MLVLEASPLQQRALAVATYRKLFSSAREETSDLLHYRGRATDANIFPWKIDAEIELRYTMWIVEVRYVVEICYSDVQAL